MALFPDLFFASSRKKDAREEAPTPIEKPTFIQQLTGTGEFMRELGAQRKKLTKEYLAERHRYLKQRRRREEEYAEVKQERREQFFGHKAKRRDLIDRDPTELELKDRKLKEFVDDYNKMEKRQREEFIKQEREGEKQLTDSHHKRLAKVSAELRARTRLPRRSPGGGFTHVSPRNRTLSA